MEEKTIDRRKDVKYGDRIINACIEIRGVSKSLKGFIRHSEQRDDALDKRINGTIKDIDKHITQGSRWRVAILGLVLGFLVQIFTFVYMFGRAKEMTIQNNKTISKLMDLQLYSKNKDLLKIVSNTENVLEKLNIEGEI